MVPIHPKFSRSPADILVEKQNVGINYRQKMKGRMFNIAHLATAGRVKLMAVDLQMPMIKLDPDPSGVSTSRRRNRNPFAKWNWSALFSCC